MASNHQYATAVATPMEDQEDQYVTVTAVPIDSPPMNPDFIEAPAPPPSNDSANTQDNNCTTSRIAGLVVSAADKCKEMDKKHSIMKRSIQMVKTAAKNAKEFDEKHKISSKSIKTSKKIGNSAIKSAKSIDEKHHVVDKSKLAASKAIEKAKAVNQKHHVTEKTAKVASFTSKKVLAGAKFVSSKMKEKKSSGRSTDEDVEFIVN